MKALKTLALGTVLGAAALFAPQAKAADVDVSFGIGIPTRPAPVIIEGGYYDHVWVEPVYRTEVYYGSPRRVVVAPGYYRQVYYSGPYRSGIVIGGSFGHHHHRHSSVRDHHGFQYRDKPGRYR